MSFAKRIANDGARGRKNFFNVRHAPSMDTAVAMVPANISPPL
jgi:hypothetical protein